ncbi:uncharacterized protein LOC135839874 [Planococcus citri]|uniref:uncharacterized protein LOC135839874 n=1 Tax=Planococcus citri TaxID=170843 RepID=UPI0031F9ADD2
MTKRAAWSEEELRAALDEIKEGSSIRTAAIRHNVPRSTVRNHLKTGVTKKRMGRTRVLQMYHEEQLVSRIVRFAQTGMSITNNVITRSVFTFCKENYIDNPFNKDVAKAGRKWLRDFLDRNPGIVPRKAVPSVSAESAKKLNRVIVHDYFERLNAAMTKLDVHDKPECVYNLDVMDCRLTLHCPANIPPKVRKLANLPSSGQAEHLVLINCGNACGQSIPPYVLVKHRRYRPKDEWTTNLPAGTKFCVAPDGRMTTEVFARWLQHFSNHRANQQGPALLIFDSTFCQLDACIMTEAAKHNLTLISLPINCTRDLQPLRQGFFNSFESLWDANILKFAEENPGVKVTLANFSSIFKHVWQESMTISNLTDAFEDTGIFPFDESAIPDEAYIPAHLTADTDLGPPIVDCRIPFVDCNSPLEDDDVPFSDDCSGSFVNSTDYYDTSCFSLDRLLELIYNDHTYS